MPSDLANVCIGIANLAGIHALWLLGYCSIVNVLCYSQCWNFFPLLSSGSIISMVLMDKLGRKVLLFWSFLSMVNYAIHVLSNFFFNIQIVIYHDITAELVFLARKMAVLFGI